MTIDKAFFAIILNLITHYMVGVAAKTANTIKYNDKITYHQPLGINRGCFKQYCTLFSALLNASAWGDGTP